MIDAQRFSDIEMGPKVCDLHGLELACYCTWNFKAFMMWIKFKSG